MIDSPIARDTKGATRCHLDRRSGVCSVRLSIVASEVRTRHVRHGRLRVEVVRLAHIHPLRGGLAVDDKRGERV